LYVFQCIMYYKIPSLRLIILVTHVRIRILWSLIMASTSFLENWQGGFHGKKIGLHMFDTLNWRLLTNLEGF
jgi:hypothetical protein